ncbi:hypothetical protein A2165_03525 [Candidatus Curtissbacteria bacterium RBG_13_40_7]|uniref:Uncharacterized protein n=1 Tax=Candidatus Curtissbacteria bacterium RBG_13_40_7 TaxID=1797706 RepID=A0A1F5FUW5_9BACT|nr:MAG: hypothetical protein A2165_03525 [Candidatus Curtissbacteria bacterium RBG_13_40_7]
MNKFTNYLLLPCLFTTLLVINFIVWGDNHHVFLAKALLNHSLSLTENPIFISDLSYFDGRFYWLPGIPFSVILSPFVLTFGTQFQEGFLKFFLSILNFWLIFKIGLSLGLNKNKSILLSIFYIFGSVYTTVASIPFSVYNSSIFASSVLLLAIYEFLNRRRWILIGLLSAIAILTRYPLSLTVTFFLIYLIKEKQKKTLTSFALPLIVSICLILLVNYLAFGNPLESGYKYRLITKEAQKRLEKGFFSPIHIPANLYYMLLKAPDPVFEDESHILKPPYIRYNPYGISLFFLSPVLLLLIKTNLKEKFVKESLIVILPIFLLMINYYGIGFRQIGYWHALDFFPFLLFPLISSFKKTGGVKLLILIIIGITTTWFFIFEFIARI